MSGTAASLQDVKVLWRQAPKITTLPGSGEPGGRIAFSPDGTYLFLTAGDRQEFDAKLVQDMGNSLGKIIRIFPDGSIPTTNPFFGRAGILPEIWSSGHRNPYGLAFDSSGRLWENEMGPKGGDELNLIERESNYGWPLVSNGDDYGGAVIPDHASGDGFAAPTVWWTPVIAPSSMIFYAGSKFAAWRGDALLGGLSSQAIVRVRFNGTSAAEVQRIPMGARIRDVREAPDGALWALEDKPSARLLKLDPVF